MSKADSAEVDVRVIDVLATDVRVIDVLVIDGRSGSGKTSFAERARARFVAAGRRPQLLRADDLFPGWGGLAEGSLSIARALETGRFKRYDWLLSAFAEEHQLEARRPLIIEGCGSLTRANLDAASRWAGAQSDISARISAVWIDCPAELRRERALTRDGDSYVPHWEAWAAQEDAHYAVHTPWALPGVTRLSYTG